MCNQISIIKPKESKLKGSQPNNSFENKIVFNKNNNFHIQIEIFSIDLKYQENYYATWFNDTFVALQ